MATSFRSSALAFLAALFLTACGGGGEGQTPNTPITPPQSSEPRLIDVSGAPPDPSAVWHMGIPDTNSALVAGRSQALSVRPLASTAALTSDSRIATPYADQTNDGCSSTGNCGQTSLIMAMAALNPAVLRGGSDSCKLVTSSDLSISSSCVVSWQKILNRDAKLCPQTTAESTCDSGDCPTRCGCATGPDALVTAAKNFGFLRSSKNVSLDMTDGKLDRTSTQTKVESLIGQSCSVVALIQAQSKTNADAGVMKVRDTFGDGSDGNLGHWVLITGTSGDSFVVMDPFDRGAPAVFPRLYTKSSVLDLMVWNAEGRPKLDGTSRNEATRNWMLQLCVSDSDILQFKKIVVPVLQTNVSASFKFETNKDAESNLVKYTVSAGKLPAGMELRKV